MANDKFESGDAVTYVPNHAHGDLKHPDCEHGIVSSVNASGTVFVRFGGRPNSQGCNPEDLVQQFPKKDPAK
jgi:hypothetical protein